jgi:uncharacterized protein YlzI (FlbEa/FlbD family)
MIWYEFNISIYDQKLEDLGVSTYRNAKAMVNLNDIQHFSQTYIHDTDTECTLINFVNGDSMVVNESYDQVKRIMRCK